MLTSGLFAASSAGQLEALKTYFCSNSKAECEQKMAQKIWSGHGSWSMLQLETSSSAGAYWEEYWGSKDWSSSGQNLGSSGSQGDSSPTAGPFAGLENMDPKALLKEMQAVYQGLEGASSEAVLVATAKLEVLKAALQVQLHRASSKRLKHIEDTLEQLVVTEKHSEWRLCVALSDDSEYCRLLKQAEEEYDAAVARGDEEDKDVLSRLEMAGALAKQNRLQGMEVEGDTSWLQVELDVEILKGAYMQTRSFKTRMLQANTLKQVIRLKMTQKDQKQLRNDSEAVKYFEEDIYGRFLQWASAQQALDLELESPANTSLLKLKLEPAIKNVAQALKFYEADLEALQQDPADVWVFVAALKKVTFKVGSGSLVV